MTVLEDRPDASGVASETVQPDVPRRRERFSVRDAGDAAGSAIVAAAAVWLLNTVLAWDSWMGSALLWLAAFLLVFGLVTRVTLGRLAATDRLVTVVLWIISATAVAALAWMLLYVAVRGFGRLGLSFFAEDLKTTGADDPGGGIRHAVLGTLIQVGLATVVCVPLAILSAVYLHELKGRAAPVLRFIVDAMSGLPSIIAGLLVYTVWILRGHGYSGAAGATALAVLMLPTVTRTSEELLRTVHDGLRESALALGAPQWQVVMRVVLPTARSGLITAVILGIARVAGETAPLLFTSFGTKVTNLNPFDGPMASVPLLVWGLIRQENDASRERAWAAALVLIILVLMLFVLARLAGDWGQIRQRRRARRRRTSVSEEPPLTLSGQENLP